MMHASKHQREMVARGKELFYIHPTILGGDPNDPSNKLLLSRQDHIKAVVFWNRRIREIRKNTKPE